MTIGTLILGSASVGATAYCFAGCLRLRGVAEFVLAVYLIAFAEVVVVSLVLSPGHWLGPTGLLATIFAVLLLAVIVWRRLGMPAPPSFRPVLRLLGEAWHDPVLAALMVAVAGGLVYVVALIVGTAPNDYDALWYHLARAAFWKQQHEVSYIAGANDYRLNAFPPNAEIADAFTMILGRSERFVGFVQFTSLGATMVAVGGIGRRLGLTGRQALFGALAFATLPVVLLQASTGLNDLVLASFLVCCTYFLFSETAVGLALAALALGLAIGTKDIALLALPVLALAALVIHPRRLWPRLAVVAVVGVVAGAYWYLFNLAETGSLFGISHRAAVGPNRHPQPAQTVLSPIAKIFRHAIDAVDPSGAIGSDSFLYGVAAAFVLAAGVAVWYRCRSPRLLYGTGAGVAVALLPLAFRPLYHELLRAYQKAWLELGERRLAFLGWNKHTTYASPFQSWYGPVGLLLLLACPILLRPERRRNKLGRAAVVLAVAPLVWLLLQSITTVYTATDGRYTIFAVALGASLWGLLLPLRPYAWGAAAAAITTLTLALIHYGEKPAGFYVLGGPAPTSVWNMSRAQLLSRRFRPDEGSLLFTFEQEATKGQTVVLDISDEASYPYFGSHLDRYVLFFPAASTQLNQANWLVLSPGKHITLPSSWVQVKTGGSGWRLYRRL
jgi:hypothetical protein